MKLWNILGLSPCNQFTLNGQQATQSYDKWDDISFPIVKFPYVAIFFYQLHMVFFVSQLIRYDNACSEYDKLLIDQATD